MIRLLPKVATATGLVTLTPLVAVWGLRGFGVVSSPLLAAALGAALSLAVYHLAANRWQRRADAADVLFGDLMLWGWVRRWLQQRRIADAAALLGSGRVLSGRSWTRRGWIRRAPAPLDPMQLSLAARAQLLERLATDLEARDAYTLGHSRRVARYAGLIAKRMGEPKEEVTRIRTAAAMHDVGKVRTPVEILRKPGALTDAEFESIKRHPGDGAEMVAILEDEALTEIVLRHHERLDGSGYPDRLGATGVPLGARIIAVADTFDAITSARPYRAAKPHKQALDILRAEAGTKLDAEVVDAFLSAYLGRRLFGAWIALTDLGERMLAWLATDAVGSGTRLAAIAAGTVAVGGGALALHATTGAARRPSGPRTAVARPHPAGGLAASGGAGSRVHVSLGSARRAGARGRPGAGSSLRFTAAAGRSHGGAVRANHAGGRSPGSGITTGRGGTSAGGASSSGAGGTVSGTNTAAGSPAGAGGNSSGSTVSVGVGPIHHGSGAGAGAGVATGSGRPTVTVGASAGGSAGVPAVSVQVTAGSGGGSSSGSGSAPTVGATVSVGPTSAGVTATVGGGKGPAGVGVGISLGGIPPIKLG